MKAGGKGPPRSGRNSAPSGAPPAGVPCHPAFRMLRIPKPKPGFGRSRPNRSFQRHGEGNWVRSVRSTFEREAFSRRFAPQLAGTCLLNLRIPCAAAAPQTPWPASQHLRPVAARTDERKMGSSSRRDATVRSRQFAALLGPPTICHMDRSDRIAHPLRYRSTPDINLLWSLMRVPQGEWTRAQCSHHFATGDRMGRPRTRSPSAAWPASQPSFHAFRTASGSW